MPKLSVYVQDDLWDQARAAEPKSNPSQLIQAALRRFVAETTGRPPFARERPTIEQTELEKIQRRLAAQARERYEHGFRSGLDLGRKLDWGQIDRLAGCNWDIKQWIDEALDYHYHFVGRRGPVFEALNIDEGLAEEITADLLPVYNRESAFRQGVVDALQQVWNTVTQDRPSSSSADTQPVPGA